MNPITLQKLNPDPNTLYVFDVPASKSITNRVLLLAALSNGPVRITHGPFADDTRALLNCLNALGIKSDDTDGVLTIHGCGGKIPNKSATLNVMSAGTVARFLPALLAVSGGDYIFESSLQMQKRPMEYLSELESAGVRIDYHREPGHYPFRMRSDGLNKDVLTVNTDTSTQYASALLIAALAAKNPISIKLTGTRMHGSYVNMTLSLLSRFGADWRSSDNVITVTPAVEAPKEFDIEGDISAACYFYAIALVFGIKVMVRHVKEQSLQGDVKFLRLLAKKGVTFTQTEEGLIGDATEVESFDGFEANFCDFSDQALTAAAIAPFATTPSVISGLIHTRAQECDRVAAIVENLNTLGVPATTDGDTVTILPENPEGGTVTTYDDHRVAMSFAITALKTGRITIDDQDCCRKTFRDFFDQISKLYY